VNTYTPVFLTVIGLILFEVISSIDNAVINSEVLASLPPPNRRWFVRWGLLMAVVGMRGILPWLIVWLATPYNGILGPLSGSLYQDEANMILIHASSRLLLLSGGTALFLIFLYWLLVERASQNRHSALRQGVFYPAGAALVAMGWYFAPTDNVQRAIIIGAIIFLILLTAKSLAAIPRQHMSKAAGRRAKMVYLEVLDSIFSIEAVLGAFAFTFSVPLILIGNGIGAIIVRTVTAARGSEIRHIAFLKRGAMYALGFIGLIMVCDGLGAELPGWLSFLTTVVAMGIAFMQANTE